MVRLSEMEMLALQVLCTLMSKVRLQLWNCNVIYHRTNGKDWVTVTEPGRSTDILLEEINDFWRVTKIIIKETREYTIVVIFREDGSYDFIPEPFATGPDAQKFWQLNEYERSSLIAGWLD